MSLKTRYTRGFPLGVDVLLVALSLGFAACGDDDPAALNGGNGGASLEWLGELDGAAAASLAWGTSPDGAVVVGEIYTGSVGEAFHWESETLLGLGLLAENSQSVAYAVSSGGSVVVGTNRGPGHELTQAFHWQSGTMTGLGHLPGGDRSFAFDVSDDGSVAVGMSNRDQEIQNRCATQAVRWVNGAISGLGSLGDDCLTPSEAHGVSPDGTVIIGHGSSDNGIEPFRWEGGAMIGLGVVDRDVNEKGVTRAAAVSADGNVVVGYGHEYSGGTFHDVAFRWEGGTLTPLGFLPGHGQSFARAVSADGSIVVGESATANASEGSAFIWTEEEGMRDLKAVLETDYGLNLGNAILSAAMDISQDGTVIVGTGVGPNAIGPQAWRVVLE